LLNLLYDYLAGNWSNGKAGFKQIYLQIYHPLRFRSWELFRF
jgi:hypothetical protein